MIDTVLKHIRNNIITLNAATFARGYYGARQYQDGRVMVYDSGEGEYVGLQDSKGNFFYIRYFDDIELDAASDSRSVSGFELTGNAPLRLVAWVRNGNVDKLMAVLLHDIQATDFSTMPDSDKRRFAGEPRIFFSGVITDAERIFKEETLRQDEDIKLLKNITIIAIDFGVIFNFKLNKDACVERDICSGCT